MGVRLCVRMSVLRITTFPGAFSDWKSLRAIVCASKSSLQNQLLQMYLASGFVDGSDKLTQYFPFNHGFTWLWLRSCCHRESENRINFRNGVEVGREHVQRTCAAYAAQARSAEDHIYDNMVSISCLSLQGS